MKVINHFMFYDDGTQVPFVASPNIQPGLEPEYLVIHYTAGPSVRAAVNTLTNPQAKVSAHLVIGRDGSITQLVPFNIIAWHAGASSWDGRVGLNKYSIGFELDNNGRLIHKGSRWTGIFGALVPNDQVMEAYHKNGRGPYGWQVYSKAQILAALEAGQALFHEYKLLDVVGHDDIAPLRKVDPGPAFPLESFRARIVGRAEDHPPVYETTSNVYIRSGAGSEFKTLIKNPLPKGTRLERMETQGTWMHAQVLDVIDGVMDLEGWVHTRYIKRVLGA